MKNGLLLHFHIGDLHTRMNFLNLVGRETDLVGRDWSPQRIWDSSIFTEVGSMNTRQCESMRASRVLTPCLSVGSFHSPAHCQCGFPMSSGLGSVKAWEACPAEQHAAASSWSCMGACSPVKPAQAPLSRRTPSCRPIGRKRTSFKRKASKRGTGCLRVMVQEIHLPLHRLPSWLDLP